MKGQLTVLTIVVILLTLFILAIVAGLFYPVLEDVLLPNFSSGDSNWWLSHLIFPIFIIGVLVMIWLWAKPIIEI